MISTVSSVADRSDRGWLLLTVFIGANMWQASITGYHPAAMIFQELGTKPGIAFP